MSSADTIAAIATPPGRGGVGIVRVSGQNVVLIAQQIIKNLPQPRIAALRSFYDIKGNIIDKGLALYFSAPNSFTGEDLLELHAHGGPVLMDMLLSTVLTHGARLAKPGEFSERAFLNGKMDLAQCEAVADLIDASTKQAALSASRSLQGVFSEQIEKLANEMMALRLYVEAAIDFPEEEIDFLSEGNVLEKIEAILSQIITLQKSAKVGQVLREGMNVVFAGLPNAGKSSLLNQLTRKESAIVTPIPGTTRDLVKETIQIDGIPINLIDTAGIRLEAELIEQEGIKRAKEQFALADKILLVKDTSQGEELATEEIEIMKLHGNKVTLVMNKVDMINNAPENLDNKIYLSAKTGQGIDALLFMLKASQGMQTIDNGAFIARRRHLDALQKAHIHCDEAHRQLVKIKAGELVAQELRYAQEALGEIVGKITPDDLLGKIFASFCIGK
ncbi:MAG: tRNA uridine-5-carboxymethylaminomethyl(34) synthesis GTPase MnmE [Proteobacteria bacterium]|nr:tRNA uridine-5-carboxymethylaminomethyl(34) synthesis GTPase MnmE [Pseudomonadota bacterium]